MRPSTVFWAGMKIFNSRTSLSGTMNEANRSAESDGSGRRKGYLSDMRTRKHGWKFEGAVGSNLGTKIKAKEYEFTIT